MPVLLVAFSSASGSTERRGTRYSDDHTPTAVSHPAHALFPLVAPISEEGVPSVPDQHQVGRAYLEGLRGRSRLRQKRTFNRFPFALSRP
jgi:hypothetical protein